MAKKSNKRKPKNPDAKMFKGCLKMPLSTDMTFDEMMAQSRWYGDWAINKGKRIKSEPRRYTINVYLADENGSKIEIITSKVQAKLDTEQIHGLLDNAIGDLASVDHPFDITKSYMTVSC